MLGLFMIDDAVFVVRVVQAEGIDLTDLGLIEGMDTGPQIRLSNLKTVSLASPD